MEKQTFNIDRRNFLKSSGHLLVGFQLLPAFSGRILPEENGCEPVPLPADAKVIDAWLRFDEKGHLTVITGKMELGQGIKTALMQMAAEELDVPMDKVSIIVADTAQTQDERYTAGSGSIEGSGNSIRQAAAEARLYLLKMAVDYLQTDISKLTVADGIVKSSGGKTASYQDLIKGKRLETEVSGNAPLKKSSEYKLIGKPLRRKDVEDMVLARDHFIQDMRLPDMVHARVLRPPVYNAKLISFPKEEIAQLPGILKVVVDGSFVGIISSDEYQCIKAVRTAQEQAKWNSPKLTSLPETLFDNIIKNSTASETVEEKGNIEHALSASGNTHEATYKRPYHMHGSIGPSCAIAHLENDVLTIWSHSQGVYPLRKSIAGLVKMPEAKIHIIGVPGAGCYGHNGADDVAADAALLALQMPGKPVRVQWMREDEHKWEPYGSAMVLKIKGGLDANGKVNASQTDIWSDTHSTRPGGNAGHLLTGQYLEKPFSAKSGGFSGGSHRNSEPLYDFDVKKIVLHDFSGPLRTSALRSLGAYANIFALESFMDEMAVKAGKDPVAFRLTHLEDARAKAVIETLREKGGWRKGRKGIDGKLFGEGIAFAQYKNHAAYFAVKAEVLVDPAAKSYRVTKLTGVIDAGQCINSDGLKNQTSGGMIQAASWTILEQVGYDENGITSTTWETYPILRFEEVPDTEVFVIDRPELPPMGAGEAAQGPTSAAIANAIFNATGSRLRELPLTPDKIDWTKVS